MADDVPAKNDDKRTDSPFTPPPSRNPSHLKPEGLPMQRLPQHYGQLLSPESNIRPGSLPPSRASGRLSGSNTPNRGGMLDGLSWTAAQTGNSWHGGGSPGEGALELEAVAAVHEMSYAVTAIGVSDMLPRTPDLIFVNVTTLEGKPLCLELTQKGWRVTSLRHDCMNGDFNHIDLHVRYFESIYALMDAVSPGYRQQFSLSLTSKLNQLAEARQNENPEDITQQDSEAADECVEVGARESGTSDIYKTTETALFLFDEVTAKQR